MFGFNARVIKVTAIVALGLMIAAVSAAAATAAPGDPPVGGYRLETSNSVSCGSVAITLRNVSPWVFGVSVLVDGAKYNGSDYNLTVNNLVSSNPFVPGPMDSDASRTLTITFPEDSGTHTVSYKVTYGSENTLYKNLPVGTATEVTVQSDCLPPVPV